MTILMNSKTTGRHRSADPDTSIDAAESIDATVIENECLRALAKAGDTGLTSEECAVEIGRELGSVTPRFRPLEDKGFVVRSDDRRPGRSGRGRIVWQSAR